MPLSIAALLFQLLLYFLLYLLLYLAPDSRSKLMTPTRDFLPYETAKLLTDVQLYIKISLQHVV
jgi:hypothetical protein